MRKRLEATGTKHPNEKHAEKGPALFSKDKRRRIAGYDQREDDDLLCSSALGKATEAVDWGSVIETISFDGETYKIYLIAVVYTSG